MGLDLALRSNGPSTSRLGERGSGFFFPVIERSIGPVSSSETLFEHFACSSELTVFASTISD
ncbi:hypothetical protein DPMN_188730 [Dreissena polymorpha]|uniref:Uncharacterized protein n=1 Tax=Dreissena polymorpha TaxID=45954 RepID=A0A9D4DRF0_DREPO|nr:hypothetical protein DPMN_188730 [Dreissena polymorpha]